MNPGRFKALEPRQKGVVRQVPNEMDPGIADEAGKLIGRLLNFPVELVPSLFYRLADDVGRFFILTAEIGLELGDKLAEHHIRLTR